MTLTGNPDGSAYGANWCQVALLILKSRGVSSSSSSSMPSSAVDNRISCLPRCRVRTHAIDSRCRERARRSGGGGYGWGRARDGEGEQDAAGWKSIGLSEIPHSLCICNYVSLCFLSRLSLDPSRTQNLGCVSRTKFCCVREIYVFISFYFIQFLDLCHIIFSVSMRPSGRDLCL